MQDIRTDREAGSKKAGLLFVLFVLCLAGTPAPVLTLFGATVSPDDAAYRCTQLKEAPPKELSADVRKALNPEGLRVLGPEGKPYVDIWLRKTVPAREDPKALGVDFGRLGAGTLLGAIRYHSRADDFRDDRIRSGLYTLRYAISPEDGDHQGVAETRDFALLCPVDLDVKPDPISSYEKIVELAVKASRRKHPNVLYLLKMFDPPKDLPRVVEQEDNEYWILDCAIPVEGKGKDQVRMGLVLVGFADEV